MEIVITMAGRGSRFRQAGYAEPKYKIAARGRTLFEWAVLSLENFFSEAEAFHFICLKEDRAGEWVRATAKRLGAREVRVVEIDATTDGQATTVLAAEPCLHDATDRLLIYNIDTHVEPACLLPSSWPPRSGWIPCFPGEGSQWSFVRADADGKVTEVREKKRISPHASVGLYGFPSFRIYKRAYEQYYAGGRNLEKGEKYVAPLYNHLLADGIPVWLHEIPAAEVHPLGTPDELNRFIADAK